jgi:hypothetical protein
LSESADQDISISEIGLYEGGSKIIIGGVARYKEKIPEYLQNLKRNEAISRSVFGLLQINKQENGGFYRFNMRGVDVE